MTYDFKNKSGNIATLTSYMLAKTIPMFEWEELPETIPYGELEKMLQTSGYAFITKHNGKLYAFNGGLGGVPDAYGSPTKIIITNPHLNFNAELDIEKDGVMISNDDMKLGLIRLYNKYNSMIVENDINLTLHGFSNRMQILLSASDDKTKESAENYVKKIIDGDISIIAENVMFDGVKVHNAGTGSNAAIKNLIEYGQYLKASLFNEVGLSANTNLKRERLVSAEVEQGEDSLFPLVYSMLKCRVDAVKKINEMFGTDIKVSLGSVWHLKHISMVDNIVEESESIVEVPVIESVESGNSETGGNVTVTETIEEIPLVEQEQETVEETVETLEIEKEVEDDEENPN